MLEAVDAGTQDLDLHERSAGAEVVAQLRELAAPLEGARILHVNATPYGGGVAEILRSEIPLLRDLGILADWKLITGDQGDPQWSPGGSARTDARRTGDLPHPLCPQRAVARKRVRPRGGPRPAAAGLAPAARQGDSAVGPALVMRTRTIHPLPCEATGCATC
jgi:hypothetical protein